MSMLVVWGGGAAQGRTECSVRHSEAWRTERMCDLHPKSPVNPWTLSPDSALSLTPASGYNTQRSGGEDEGLPSQEVDY